MIRGVASWILARVRESAGPTNVASATARSINGVGLLDLDLAVQTKSCGQASGFPPWAMIEKFPAKLGSDGKFTRATSTLSTPRRRTLAARQVVDRRPETPIPSSRLDRAAGEACAPFAATQVAGSAATVNGGSGFWHFRLPPGPAR